MEEMTNEPLCENAEAIAQEDAEGLGFSELDAMKRELEELRATLAERDRRDAERERAEAELGRFREYFPTVSHSDIPGEVWESVRGGESLAGAYSLYLRRGELERERISEFNKKTSRMSAGSLTRDGDDKYFSPAEVKKMTPAQVRQNYDDIVESMRHWN